MIKCKIKCAACEALLCMLLRLVLDHVVELLLINDDY